MPWEFAGAILAALLTAAVGVLGLRLTRRGQLHQQVQSRQSHAEDQNSMSMAWDRLVARYETRLAALEDRVSQRDTKVRELEDRVSTIEADYRVLNRWYRLLYDWMHRVVEWASALPPDLARTMPEPPEVPAQHESRL